MRDITELINRHRECSRHLWNTYFLPQAEADADWDLRDQFEDVSAKLFSSLVLWPLERETHQFKPAYLLPHHEVPFIRVIPKGTCLAQVNREIESGYWDHPITELKEGDVDMRFIQYFDWENLGHREYEFIRVLIVSSAAHPELDGRHALVKPLNIRVEFDETAP
jgi:hypothetical protein